MSYPNGSEVEVRNHNSGPWYPGVVIDQDGLCYHVSLDAPNPTADEWENKARRYGGSSPVMDTRVNKQVDQLDPNQLIRPRS